MAEAALGLGTNLGDREAALAQAADRLERMPGIEVTAISGLYASAPWGVADQPDFLNLCLLIETDLGPLQLLHACKAVEAELGRQERLRWGPREMDVDVLLMAGVEMDTKTLAIPHPRMAERRFVLEPLAEIAPDWVLEGGTVRNKSAALKHRAADQICVLDEGATRRFASLQSA
jgi:2-amino-4-hydroxy-6-hydroxymethyldihydropteridine diphosphokinase